jgi:serine/threonine protein kinase
MIVRDQEAEARRDPMIGRMILDYQIIAKLAEGGMGAVYVARHQHLEDTKKVIKVLLPEYAQNPMIRQRFEREAKAVSRLKHDNILGIDGFGMLDDGQLFLRIPFLDGQPLDAYLRARGGRIAEHRALHILIQLCDALDHAHAMGIIHRDLKPQNVFVVRTNQNWAAIKLLDFGIAKVIGEEDLSIATKSGIAIGTPSYMAVEQYEHADKATHLADVYSLAVMIWEMVTGELPWRHHDQAVLYFQQKTVIPERPPASKMSPAWTDVLLAALSAGPAARPQSVRELALALASATPAIGRVPSGAEILSSLAPHFVHNALPSDETVRNASDVDRLGPLLWPTHETGPGAARALPPLHVATSSERYAGTPAMAATANERPPARPPALAPQTTLGAASGVTSEPSPRPTAGWKVAIAAIGACAFAGAVTFMIAHRLAPSSETNGARELATVPSAKVELDARTLDAAASNSASTALDAHPVDAGTTVIAVPSSIDAGVATPPTETPPLKVGRIRPTKAPPTIKTSPATKAPPAITIAPATKAPPTSPGATGERRGKGGTFDPDTVAGED